LQAGELLRVSQELSLAVVAYETGLLAEPSRIVQRVLATRGDGPSGGPTRLPGPASSGG
jgi:hypothetical protein